MINCIQYPKEHSEVDVQAELYGRLKLARVDVRAGVTSACEDGEESHRVYLDLVVFKDRQAVAIIECKNHSRLRQQKIGERQQRRYSKFEVPLIFCLNMSQIDETCEAVLILWREFNPKTEREPHA